MEVELLEKEGTKMKVKIVGESHAFANALRKELHKDDRIETAAYNVDHPLLSDPVLQVKTSENTSPQEVLSETAKKLASDYADVQNKLEKALKQ